MVRYEPNTLFTKLRAWAAPAQRSNKLQLRGSLKGGGGK